MLNAFKHIHLSFRETNQGLRGLSQQLSEWAVMREVLWVLLCPVPSHIFILNSKGLFALKPNITLASLTPVSENEMWQIHRIVYQ